jgi:translation initiation factor 3 subunit L
MSSQIAFSLPDVIKDFIFDLFQSSRRTGRVEEIQVLYDQKFKELSDKYFTQSPWPEPEAISKECNDDEIFLLFYKEMSLRHRFSKMKSIPIALYLEAWENYNRLFNILLSSKENFIVISTQWAYDIIQEFVYTFQSYCQYRLQHNRTEEELHTMEANKDAWSLPVVSIILNNVIRMSQELAAATAVTSTSEPDAAVTTHALFGYFASIENARLECLLSDYTTSLESIQNIRLWDQNELFTLVPTCHVNVYYHAGVSMLMMRRYSDCIDTLSTITLHILRVLKPGNSTPKAIQTQHSKMMDKILSLLAIAISLSGGRRVDDQVMEVINAKLSDRFRRLNDGDIHLFEEMFEHSCPKFISPAVAENGSAGGALEAWKAQVAIFVNEIQQQVTLFKLSSYLRLYSSIELEKMASFNDISQDELVEQLLSSRHKSREVIFGPCTSESSGAPTDGSAPQPVIVSDINYFIEDGNLVIGAGRKSNREATEKFFMAGIRKNAEITADMQRVFTKYGI